MAISKAKSAKKSSFKKKDGFKPKTVDTVEANTTNERKSVISVHQKQSFAKVLFARKCDESENILTIFQDRKIIAAIIGEVLGTGLLTIFVLTLGLSNPLYTIFAYAGITAAVFALSGANLNPIITAGMLASRRYSAIRGTLYIIAQVLGSWLAYLLLTAFFNSGVESGAISAASASLPTLTQISDLSTVTEGYSYFWPVTMIEFIGAIIIAFFFARALRNKQSTFTFSCIAATGIFLASLFAILTCSNLLGISYDAAGNQATVFIMNPAIALMYGALPASADSLGELFKALCPVLVTYVIFPVLGGIIGTYLSDFASVCAEEKLN